MNQYLIYLFTFIYPTLLSTNKKPETNLRGILANQPALNHVQTQGTDQERIAATSPFPVPEN